jgi:hypothetical protein
MATPTCPKCGYTAFITMPVPFDASMESKLVCCGNCYAVVGVTTSVDKINKKVDWLIKAVENIGQKLGIILIKNY